MNWATRLPHAIADAACRTRISALAQHLSAAEQTLLADILHQFSFDNQQAQALLRAVEQQSRFQPHAEHNDDEEVSAPCPHCLAPTVPPLRDYQHYRCRLADS